MRLRISDQELARRRRAIAAELEVRHLEALVLFNAISVFYTTNFAFIPTERPLAVVLTADGRTVGLVPRLEREHAEQSASFDRVDCYGDNPGLTHPMTDLARMLKDLGLGRARLGADSDGYGAIYGYEGPRLSEVLPEAVVENCRTLVEYMRHCKSPEEIELIRESARWGNLAHSLLQQYVRAGATETEVSVRASLDASLAMTRTLGPAFEPRAWTSLPAHADLRGQIGRNASNPHAIGKNIRLQDGDVVVTGAAARVWGYTSELERTMFVGAPSKEQEKYFGLMMQAQETAFAAIRPGKACADVDRAVRRFYEEAGIMETWRHHTGHNLGLEIHEAPFLDVGDDRELRPGMVFSVEPGVYVSALGGFRHSDTVVVTETGMDLISYYPRRLEDLVCG